MRTTILELTTILVGFLLMLVDGCGITTHTEIAHRAASHYDRLLDNKTSIGELIKKFQPAFQAGNPYPDSFYPSICKKGVLHDVSEDTHWVPFINATVTYIQKTFPKPYNQDALRLIVFLLGFTSHQMADVTWHSLGVPQGFLSAMGYVNFHGSFDQAHPVGDFGGDIVNQFELNTDYIADLGEWYVPYDDLYNIYKQYYGKEMITKNDIIECSSLLFIGRLAEQVAVSLLYADYYKKSSFMVDKLNDYFLGGLDDMATWTQISWDKVLYMIENGVDKCKLDHNILYLECGNIGRVSKPRTIRKEKTKEKKVFSFDDLEQYRIFMDTEITEKGAVFKANDKFYEYMRSYNKVENLIASLMQYNLLPAGLDTITELRKPSNELVDEKGVKATNTTYFLANSHAQLGYSLVSYDVNGDGFDDLVMGAPVYSEINLYQNGAVFVVLADSSTGSVPLRNLNVEKEANVVIKPPSESIRGRFGHSIAVLDLNLDGFNDIVISAPSFDLRNINYEGRVYVYFGDKSGKYNEPKLKITCKNFKYCNIGWSLTTGDIDQDGNKDLIIGSPFSSTCGDQCGFVGILLSSKKSYPSEVDANNLDWILKGNMSYEWFGHSVSSREGYLLVGAPESRICAKPDCDTSKDDVQSVGRAYLYKYPSKTPLSVVRGDIEYEQLGYSCDLSDQSGRLVAAISSPSKDTRLNTQASFELNRGGVVQLFELLSGKTLNLTATLKSDRPYSGFGSKIKFYSPFGSDNEDLYISAYLRSDDILLLDQVEDGIIYRFKGGSSLPKGNVTDDCPATDLTPCPSKKASTIFTLSEKKSQFGTSFALMRTTNKVQLNIATSSIHSSPANSRMSGKINIFNFNF